MASRPDYAAQRRPLTGTNIPRGQGTMPVNGDWPDVPTQVASQQQDSTGLVAVNPSR